MKDRLTKFSVVLANFTSIEDRLVEYLNFLPYTKDTQLVVSPRFIPIILDACSLIDSILRSIIQINKRTTFKNLALETEQYLELSNAFSIFLTPNLAFLNPFETWIEKVPEWWNAYNSLKHDRIGQYSIATYENSVLALCALHQVIARNIHFIPNLISSGWFNIESPDVGELILAQNIQIGVRPLSIIPVESKLFVTPNRLNFVESSQGQPYVKNNFHFSPRVIEMLSAVDCIEAGEYKEDQY